MMLTPGNVSDHKTAKACLAAMPPSKELIADKGYDSTALREWLMQRGTEPVIPPRKNRKIQYEYDRALYKQRNVIERTFGRIKDFRRIAIRFDRNVKNFLAACCIAAAVIWWLQ
jgi:transposase